MEVAVLVFLAGPLTGTTRVIDRDQLSVGRDEGASISIADPALSRAHCVIERQAAGVIVRDLESLNGTFVNGVPIRERPLADGDRVRIGDSICIFVGHGDETPVAPADHADGLLHADSTVCLRREDARYLTSAQGDARDAHPRTARDLRALLDISQAVHSARRSDVLQRHLLESTLRAVPADCGAVAYAAGADEPALVHHQVGAPMVISQTVARRVLRDGVAVMSNGVNQDEALADAPSLVDGGARSVLCAPLAAAGRTFGLLYLANRNARSFDADDLQLLMGIAGIAGAALEHIRGVEELARETERSADPALDHDMIGESAVMRDVYQTIARLAATASTVLIRGESGTGKELAARAVHRNGARAHKAFVAINCAALTDTLLESELFGHEKGSFTGAIAQKRGKLELADGGTLFLDEIGDLTPALQVKLLRVLQEREFERVGGTRSIKVDIRLIAATHRDLEASIKSGAFRADLYYRLNVVSLTMPALRDRSTDIPLLAAFFIRRYSTLCNRRVQGMSEEARSALIRYSWPGNVRELENAIERAVVMGSSDRVRQEDLPESVLETHRTGADPLTHYHGALNDTKRRLIITAVERAAGNYTEAAKILGVHPNYLHRLVRNLALKDELTRRTS